MGDAMAAPDPLLDEELTDEDRRTVNDIEAPVAQSGEGPAPLDLEDIQPTPPSAPPVDLNPPEIGSEGPTMQTPLTGVPGAEAAAPTTPPLPGTAPVPPGMQPVTPPKPGSAEDIAQRQGLADVERAKVNAGVSDQQLKAAQLADEDARLERADYLQRRQDAEKDLAERTKRYEAMKFQDPRQKTKGFKSTLAVIFGGLGAAYRSAGGGDAHNTALAALQKKWDDDAEIQRANIAAAKDSVVQARTRIDNIDEGRRIMTRDADAQLLSKYNLALKQGEAQLKNQGVNQAGIDADARIQQLRVGQAAAAARARKDEDEHALNQAKINRLNAQAMRDQRKAAGGGGKSAKTKMAEHRMQLADEREERAEAAPVIKEIDESLKEFRAKGGVKESLEHSERSLSAVEKSPDNPTNWVNLVDAMIRSNTGRSAILSQYKLYTGHAAGSIDEAAQLFHKLADGGLSDTQKTNLLGAAKTSNSELRGAAKDVYDNFRRYDEDPRVAANQTLHGHYVATERNMFGTLPGYQKPAKAPEAAPAAVKPAAKAAPSKAEDSEALKWAKAHLSDPRAKKIIEANGGI